MFEGADRIDFSGLDIVVLRDAKRRRDELNEIEEKVLELATFARGWGPEMLPRMREVFKIEPLYKATSLVLAFKDGRLSGTAGVDQDFEIRDGRHILHLCSVNLGFPIRNGGLLPLLLLLLSDHVLSALPSDAPVYFTSISQSPVVYSLISRLALVYPNEAGPPPADVIEIGRRVAEKYDAHLSLETDTLILRHECDFFYRDVPYVADSKINELFDRMLDIPGGDVFVQVGKTRASSASQQIDRFRRRFQCLTGNVQHG